VPLAPANEEFVSIARVVRPQGRRGEVVAEPLTNVRAQFSASTELHARNSKGDRRRLELEAHWFHKDRVVLKFRGVDSITQAEELRGCDLDVPRRELLTLEAGSYYVDQLVGCSLFDRGKQIGVVSGIQFGAGEAPLLVVAADGKELLIPFAQEFVVAADIAARRIEMNLPERLLELDAPLSEEEKRAQRRPQ
jgi:16S rRNA processing protein RimM